MKWKPIFHLPYFKVLWDNVIMWMMLVAQSGFKNKIHLLHIQRLASVKWRSSRWTCVWREPWKDSFKVRVAPAGFSTLTKQALTSLSSYFTHLHSASVQIHSLFNKIRGLGNRLVILKFTEQISSFCFMQFLLSFMTRGMLALILQR